MSVFTEISRKIGHFGDCHLPSKERAEELLMLVRQGNVQAFEEVFRIYRFTPVTEYLSNQTVSNICFQAWTEGKEIFLRMEA